MRSLLLYGLCLGAAFAACADPEETDSGTPDSGIVADSGVPRDTGVVTDSGAPRDTGGDDAGAPDTGTDDTGAADTGATDTGATDAALGDGGGVSGPVTVIFDPPPGLPTPLPGAAIFHDPSGVLIASLTSTTGSLVQDVPPGSMLTIPSLSFGGKGPPAFELTTLVGIEPGETYHVDRFGGEVYLGSVTFFVGDAFPGAAYYTFQSGCGQNNSFDAAQAAPLDFYDYCIGTSTTTADVLVTAYDQADQPIAHRGATQVPLIPGSMVTMTDPWQTTFQDIAVTVTNPPTGSASFQPYLALTSRGAVYNGFTSESVDLSGGAGGSVLFHRETFGDGVAFQGYLRGANGELSQLVTRVGSQGPITLDLSADFLPLAGPVTVTPSPTVERPMISWNAPAVGDLVGISFLMYGPDVNWSFIFPPTVSSFALPELPDELVDQRPNGSTAFEATQLVIESSAIADYAQFRALAQANLVRWINLDPRSLPVGVRIRISNSGF